MPAPHGRSTTTTTGIAHVAPNGDSAAETGALAFSYEQTAKKLNCSPRTVFTMVANGQLRAIRLGRRLVRIPLAEIERFLAANLDEQPVA